jgi:hypothetical protein
MRPATPTEPAAATREPAALVAVDEEPELVFEPVAEAELEPEFEPEAAPVVEAPEEPPVAVAPEEPPVALDPEPLVEEPSWTEVFTQLVLVPDWMVTMDENAWLPLESFKEIVLQKYLHQPQMNNQQEWQDDGQGSARRKIGKPGVRGALLSRELLDSSSGCLAT